MRPRLALLACLASLLSGPPAVADTLDDIRARGHLVCAVNIDTDDYSEFDGHGNVSGFETDYCRALAASILGDPARAVIDARRDEISGLREVRDHHADIMLGATPDPALGSAMHLAFAPPVLIDGQGFLVDPKLGITRLTDIKGARVCWIDGTPAMETVRNRLDELGVAFTPFPFQERGEMLGALATNHCNLVTGDITELANLRLSLPALKTFAILARTITVDPLAPALREADARLMTIVTAVDNGLLQAEEHGVTRANVADLAQTSRDPIVRRLVGADGWIGRALGLDDRWLSRAIQAVGNHGEIYRRDVGDGSELRLPAGVNAPVPAGALVSVPVEIAR